MNLTKLKTILTILESNLFQKIAAIDNSSLFGQWIASKATDLDFEFVSTYGDKPIAPLLDNLLVDGEITDANMTKLARYIYNKYISNWNHLIQIEQSNYNVLAPYSISETRTTDETIEDNNSRTTDIDNSRTETEDNSRVNTKNLSNSASGSDTTANTGTQGTSSNGSVTESKSDTQVVDREDTSYVYGFNTDSTDGVKQARNETDNTTTDTQSNTSSTTDSSTRTDNLSEETTYGKVEALTGTDSVDEDKSLTVSDSTDKTETENNSRDRDETVTTSRVGNIGNQTFTELVEKEYDFWTKFNYTDTIFRDVAKMLVLDIYEINI